jgi:hypothetical protein
MSTGLESEAAFRARATEIGLPEDAIDRLKLGGVKSFGSYAFITNYQPGQADEKPLITALTQTMGREPTNAETIALRRLFFESTTLAVHEFKQRSERDETAEPTKMPVAERNARLEDQKKRLPGLHFSPETEPSHKLVDTICQMAVDQTLEWTPWEKLTSRSSEITHSQKDLKFSLDSQGSVKVAAKTQSPDANITGEMRVRQALNRRARAFDLAQLCKYTVMEAWHERIFEVLQKEPAPNAMPVTMHQLREADKMLFRKLAEKTRGALAQQPDGSKPMEAHFDTCADHPEVQFCLIPMVRGTTKSNSADSPSPKPKGKGKGNGKVRKDFNKPPFQSAPQALPPNCHQMTPQGKPICNTFNRGSCDFAKPGKRCKRGFHVCWQCFKPKPFSSCDHS